MQDVISALEKERVGRLLPNEPLAPYTTWGIGGPVDLLVVPETKEELVRAVRVLRGLGKTWTNIGKGSNLLVTDKGVRGVMIKLGGGMETVRFEGTTVYAGAAFGLIKLSVLAGRQGLTGLEFAGGIPGSVGGAVFMNAGALGSDLSRVLKYAEVLLESGELVQLSNEELDFAYRHSWLQSNHAIVTEAVFELEYGDRKEIAAVMATFKERRIRTQPLHEAVAGSVFRNPPGHYAAKLIEEAGLKGYRIGGAEVSQLHANFIVNTGNATAKDVLTLIEHIQAEVEDKFDVRLNPEVLVVGER